MDADLTSYSLWTHRYKIQSDKRYRIKQAPTSAHYHIFHHHHHCHHHHHANLWSLCPVGSVCEFVAPWWPEVMKVRVQAGPPVSAPAGTPRWRPDPPRDRRREPLRSRPPDLHSVWSRSRKPSDRHRAGQQRSESTHALPFSLERVRCVMQTEWKHLMPLTGGIYLVSAVAWGVVIIRPKTCCFCSRQSITALVCTFALRCIIQLNNFALHSFITLNKLWGIYESSIFYIFNSSDHFCNKIDFFSI